MLYMSDDLKKKEETKELSGYQLYHEILFKPVYTLWFIDPKTLTYLAFQSFDFERIYLLMIIKIYETSHVSGSMV